MILTKENITKETFLLAMEKLSGLTDGIAKKIAKEADFKYNTYKYYVYGESADTPEARENMWIIYLSALKVSDEPEKKILTAISHKRKQLADMAHI